MIAAISSGKGIIEPLEPVVKQAAMAAQQPTTTARSKAPAGIKTNIKAGSSSQYANR